MGKYAANTDVAVHRSKTEIERTLERYGANQFITGWDADRETAMVGFKMNERQVRFMLPMPDRGDPEFTRTPTGKRRKVEASYTAWEQGCRQRWRALALAIKAKLEAVESGITEFEEEFMAHIVLPNGSTFGTWAVPQIQKVYDFGEMPEMLPQLTAGEE